MGKRQDIDEQAWSPADPSTVYQLLADASTWPSWSGIDSFERRDSGPDPTSPFDEVRVFRTGRVTSVERVVEVLANRRLSYQLLDGLPLRDYRADVDLAPVDGGTSIRWHSTFVAERAGAGWFYRLVLGRFIRGCIKGLAAYAAQVPQSV